MNIKKVRRSRRLSFPKELILRFASANTGRAIEGIICDITLFAHKKNNYDFQPPPTDFDGVTIIRRSELEKEIRNIKSFWIMDYESELDDCLNKIQLVVPSAEEISQGITEYLGDAQARAMYKAQYKRALDVDALRNNQNGKYEPKKMFLDLGDTAVPEKREITIKLKPIKEMKS